MRYSTKDELVTDIVAEHDALSRVLDLIPGASGEEEGVWGDGWSIADLLSHLAEWHSMLLRWWREGLEGRKPAMPAPGFKWSETPRLNRTIQEKHRGRSFADSRTRFEASHAEVLGLVRGLSSTDIFEPGRFGWTGKNPLVTYVGANTASHYRFARKVIKRWQRSRAADSLPGDSTA